MTGEPVYVFGVVAADHPAQPADLVGVGGPAATVRRVAAGATAAVVAAAPARLRAKRRDLLAHQLVLDCLWQRGPVLPMRFGVVAADEERLRAELVHSAGRHLDALAQVTGRAEVNVKVTPDEDRMVRLVADDPAIRRLRQRAGRSYVDRLRLGETVAAAVQARAAEDARLVLAGLHEFAVRDAAGPPVEGCALNASFLVADERMAGFLNRVAELDGDLDGRCRVRAFGPMPPYSFTEPIGG